jgi:spermidine/putrescine transport system permease protein
MSAITGAAADAVADFDLRPVRAYRLRFDRVAGWLFLASALLWIGLLGGLLARPDMPEPLPVIQTLAALGSQTWPALVAAGLLALAVLDVAVGAALLRGHRLAHVSARARALIGLALCAFYFAAARDFPGAFAFAAMQGLILVLLSRSTGLIMLYPSMVWLVVFFLVPLVSVVAFSLGRGSTLGAVDMSVLTLENYQRIVSPVGISGLVYLNIIVRTVWFSLVATILCMLIGYPFAFWMARQPERVRNALLLLVMVPFWTSILVRTYAWLIILRKDGLVNNLLIDILHLIDKPLEMTNTPGALLLGMVYDYLPFAILPLYSSIERLDWSLVEAASDLYANGRQTFLRVILPLTTPGIVAGSILVFIPSIGTYVVSNVLGGGKVFLIGNLLEQQFIGTTGDRAFGAAIGFILAALMLVATVIYFRLGVRNR